MRINHHRFIMRMTHRVSMSTSSMARGSTIKRWSVSFFSFSLFIITALNCKVVKVEERADIVNWLQVVMSCTIKKDFQYNRVMPTFHHWKTGNLKYGKTNTSASDLNQFNPVRTDLQDNCKKQPEPSQLNFEQRANVWLLQALHSKQRRTHEPLTKGWSWRWRIFTQVRILLTSTSNPFCTLTSKYVDKCQPFAMSISLHEINQDGETVIDVIGIALWLFPDNDHDWLWKWTSHPETSVKYSMDKNNMWSTWWYSLTNNGNTKGRERGKH